MIRMTSILVLTACAAAACSSPRTVAESAASVVTRTDTVTLCRTDTAFIMRDVVIDSIRIVEYTDTVARRVVVARGVRLSDAASLASRQSLKAQSASETVTSLTLKTEPDRSNAGRRHLTCLLSALAAIVIAVIITVKLIRK